MKVRPRIFFEGNLFMDLRPGTPSAPEVDDGFTIPASQTAAPVQIDQVLGTLTTSTREDLQKLLIGYGNALNGEPEPGEDDDQDPDVQGETAAESLNDSLDFSADSLRGGAVVNRALLGTDLHDLSKLVGGTAEDLLGARLAREPAEGPHLELQHHDGRARVRAGEPARDDRRAAQVLEAANPALDNLNAAFPDTRAWALEMIPGVRETPATIAAGFPWIRQTRALLQPS